MRQWIAAVCAAVLIAGPLWADDWASLSGTAIADALTGRILAYDDGAVQIFLPGGLTRYGVGWPNEGRWRVSGDQYCSVWPPSELWACYGVEIGEAGQAVRFTAGDGSVSLGRYRAE